MRAEVRRDLADGEAAFCEFVWPAISPQLGGGEFEPTAGALDEIAGIDGWQKTESWMRGIAHRVQWGTTDWRTFTIRFARPTENRTEWEKLRAAARDRSRLGPDLVIHAYLRGARGSGEIISIGAARARDIVRFATGLPSLPVRSNPADGVRFVHCGWDEMRRAGYELRVYPPAPRELAEPRPAADPGPGYDWRDDLPDRDGRWPDGTTADGTVPA